MIDTVFLVLCMVEMFLIFLYMTTAIEKRNREHNKYKGKIARLEKINLALFTELEKVKDEMKDGRILYHQGREAFDYPTTEIQKALDMAMEYHDEV